MKNLDQALGGRIGLALSGGGYRAAGFHLGVLEYLDRIDATGRIQALSTVSGGTFTGASWCLSFVKGQRFGRWFAEFHDFLRRTDLVRLGLDRLSEGPARSPSRRRDLIVSMADVYAHGFLELDGQPARFRAILECGDGPQEVAFNATEFRHGLAFRFQKSANPTAKIGNGDLHIPRDDAGTIRLGDIVASSSCFPGGFEPLAFPVDFVWPDDTVPAGVREAVGEIPVALMDGGVYDNQGIGSLLLADERREGDLDVFIISDVDQKSDDLFEWPASERPTFLTLGMVGRLILLVMITCLVTLGVIVRQVVKTWPLDVEDVFLYLVPALLSLGVAAGAFWVRRTVRRQLAKVPKIGRAAWDDVKSLRVSEVVDMIHLRIGSLMAMAGSVFMKRVRSLVYGLVYRDGKYEHARVSCLIYHLASGEKFAKLPDVQPPTQELQRRIDRAVAMDTTLWFDNDEQLADLVVTGQATIVYNLMKLLVRRHGDDESLWSEAVRALWEELISDWNGLREDPGALLSERLAASCSVA